MDPTRRPPPTAAPPILASFGAGGAARRREPRACSVRASPGELSARSLSEYRGVHLLAHLKTREILTRCSYGWSPTAARNH